MIKAFVDSTILTDALIKSGESKKCAIEVLKKFDITELPVFAIKEFKAGPLKNFVWMHNKLVSVRSYEKALEALQHMSMTPRRYTTSTALEALKEAAGSISKKTPANFAAKYGDKAAIDKILCDEFRLAIKTAIMKAWKKRRKITTDIVFPLPCYHEVSPYEKRGLIEIDPKRCDPSGECSLASLLRDKLDEMWKMREAIKGSAKLENQRRSKTLRQLYRKPKERIQESECQNLGDAIYVLLSPSDSVIITTNITDYKPLVEAIGKMAKSPKEILV
jgi:hypothetical protein